MGITYQYLDGSTPEKERRKQVDAFQSGASDAFLISIKAGGRWHLNRIRKTPGKPGWLLGMIAALFVPVVLFPFMSMIVFSIMAFYLFMREPGVTPMIAWFLGGALGLAMATVLASVIVWLTYRWVFPRTSIPSTKLLQSCV